MLQWFFHVILEKLSKKSSHGEILLFIHNRSHTDPYFHCLQWFLLVMKLHGVHIYEYFVESLNQFLFMKCMIFNLL